MGVLKHMGYVKMTIYDHYLAISQKRCKIEMRLLWNANRNSYALYRMALGLFPVTLNCSSQTTPFPSQAGTVRKWLNRSSSFWHRGFPRLILHCVEREFGYFQK